MPDPVPILHVHHRSELAGAPTSLAFLIRGLDRQRYRPHVLCPPGPVVEYFRRTGAEMHVARISQFTHVIDSRYAGLRWALFALELAKLPGHWWALRRAIRKTGARIVHLNESSLLPAAILARRLGCKVVWHVRHNLGPGRRRELLVRNMQRYADLVIAIDEDVRSQLADLPGIEVVHNSVDLEIFAPNDGGVEVRSQLGVPKEAVCIGQVGRLHEAKGTFEFIEACSLLAASYPEARFLLIGGALYRPDFFRSPKGRLVLGLGLYRDYGRIAREMVARRRLDGQLKFVDWWHDMPSMYSALDIVVFNSRLKGIGRPAFEAAACGRPVVATSSTGIDDVVVDGGNGLLVPPRDPQRLAEAIARLIDDQNLRQAMGRAGLEHARAKFDMRANARRVMDLYDRILGERSAATADQTLGMSSG